MYCIHNGKCSMMVKKKKKGEYVYITEKKWHKLTKEQKKRYKLSYLHEETNFERAMINV